MNIIMIVLNNVANDNRVLKSAKSLIDLGHKVEIYGISPEKGIQTKPKLKKVNNQLIRFFPNPRYFLYGCKTPIDSWKFMIEYFSTVMKVVAMKFSPEVIYTHDYNTIAIGRRIVDALRSNGKYVYWVHDLHEYVEGLTTTNNDIRNAALEHERENIHLPDRLMTVSPMLAKTLTEKYNLKRSPKVLLNAPIYKSHDANYQPTVRQSVGLASGIPLIVYVGGVAQARGVHTAVHALPKLAGVHLVLVTNSQGDYIQSLKNIAKEQRCADRLHIIPYAPPDKVSSFVRDATVAIHPMIHYPNAEIALPNKLFEYIHSGVPIIVSDCESMSKFVRKWRVGEVFESENVNDFVRAVKHVVARRDLYITHLSEFRFLRQRFSWESQANIFKDLDKEIGEKYRWCLKRSGVDLEGVENGYDRSVKEEAEHNLFNLVYDSTLSDSLFSNYYFCCSQDSRQKGDLYAAKQYAELSSLFSDSSMTRDRDGVIPQGSSV